MFYRVLATSQQFVWRGSQSIDKRLEWPHFAQKASLYTMDGMAQIVSKNLSFLSFHWIGVDIVAHLVLIICYIVRAYRILRICPS